MLGEEKRKEVRGGEGKWRQGGERKAGRLKRSKEGWGEKNRKKGSKGGKKG